MGWLWPALGGQEVVSSSWGKIEAGTSVYLGCSCLCGLLKSLWYSRDIGEFVYTVGTLL